MTVTLDCRFAKNGGGIVDEIEKEEEYKEGAAEKVEAAKGVEEYDDADTLMRAMKMFKIY